MAVTLGIDIGKHGIRGAVVRTTLRTHEVDRYLEVPVSSLDPAQVSSDIVLSAIRELVAQLGAPPSSIVVAIEGTKSSIRAVEIPALAKKRAHDVLPFELDPLLPFPVEEALIDYQEIAAQGAQVLLLTAAVPEAVIAETLETLARAEVYPRELAVGAAALDGLTPFLAQPPGEAWLLVHLDHQLADVAVIRNGVCELARTIDEGYHALLTQPQAIRASLHQTLMKYRAEDGPLPAKVVVMGLGSEDDGVVEWLGQALGLPAEAVTLPGAKDAVLKVSPAFGKALALAGRTLKRGKRIDMRRGKFAPPRGVSLLRDYALLSAACVAAVVMSYVFSVWVEYRVLAEERDALAEKLGEVTKAQFGERTTTVTRARLLLEGGGGRNDPLPRFDAFHVLAAVSNAVPPGIVHDTRELEIEFDENGQLGKLHLEGTIPDLTARDQIAEALDAHACIGDLERGKTSTVPGQDKKNYTLDAVIACPGVVKPTKGKSKPRSSGVAE